MPAPSMEPTVTGPAPSDGDVEVPTSIGDEPRQASGGVLQELHPTPVGMHCRVAGGAFEPSNPTKKSLLIVAFPAVALLRKSRFP